MPVNDGSGYKTHSAAAPALWLRWFFLSAVVLLGAVGLFNWYIDPLGCRNKDGAFVDLLYDDAPEFVKARFDSERYDLALLGSSRLFRADPWFLDSLTGRYSMNLSVAGASFSLNVKLLERIRQRGGAVLCGFDCFTLNKSREFYPEEAAKQARFDQVFDQPAWADFMTIRLLNYATLRQSMREVYRHAKGKHSGATITAWDTTAYPMLEDIIPTSFEADAQNKFSQFTMYPDSVLLHFASLFEAGDKILIPAKYYRWYDYFDRYGIADQYFDAIALVVKHTKADVYSFYGRSAVTRDSSNFDENGWHYKPRIARRMLSQLYAEGDRLPPDALGIGVKLTAQNVDGYLDSLRLEAQLNGLKH